MIQNVIKTCVSEKMISHNLLNCLSIPEKVVSPQRTSSSGLEGLCILLKRLAYPCRYADMVSRFGRNPTEICLIFNEMLSLVFSTHHHRLESFEQPFLSPENLIRYANSIHAHVPLWKTVFVLLMEL